MKNYPHLYPNPLSKKINNLNKTPKKQPTPTHTITTKTSYKTILPYSPLTRQKRPHIRNLTRSIEENRSQFDTEGSELNCSKPLGSQQDEELFSQSYSKIGRIKQTLPQKNIDSQLNEVLTLIREQKNTINERMRALKRSNDQYKQLYESYMKGKIDCGVNTDLNMGQSSLQVDCAVECEIACQIKIQQDQTQNSEKNEQVTHNQNYLKICKILQDMNINPKDILPTEKEIPSEILIADYKQINEKQIIQIQKFFIKKLIEKINK